MSVRIHHGGREYTVVDRSMDELRAEIGQAITSGAPYWLAVKSGEGRPSEAVLLITPGIDLALVAEEDAGQTTFDEIGEDETLA